MEHTIERAVILCSTNFITDLGFNVISSQKQTNKSTKFIIKPLNDHEREYILKVLKECGGKVKGSNGAAALLGLPPTTLTSKMQKLGIKKGHIQG
ncbi:MAG: hypothetical protein NTW25_10270 [Candidatus Kapabacteria bacterium]|nr:hypothetical protein [Candidatus Kapabacteria bacterium]